jgi:hypothetical protein
LLNDPNKKAFDLVEDVGIVIRTLGPARQVHIGMLYKIGATSALNLNLRDHLDLRNEAPTDSYCWMQIQLDDINRRVLASLCALIAKRGQAVPYGFTYNGQYFTEAGEYVHRDLGHGLTCATFVMALFETYSIPVLLTSEWTVADLEDQGWQAQRVQQIAVNRGDFIASAIRNYVGHPRYKPEHVAGGAVDQNRPLGLAKATKVGRRILRDLEKMGRPT